MERQRFAGGEAGVSLIELMIGVTILAILTSLALPSFGKMIKDNRRTVTVNEILSSVLQAREEAAKRGQSVVVCGGYGTTCATSGTWDSGWQVFVDVNDSGNIESNATLNGATWDETGLVLRRYGNSYSRVKIRSSVTAASLKPFQVAGTAASILICDERGSSEARVVCIATNGRAASQSTDCNTGGALACP